MKHSESLKNIAPAIHKAQADIKGAIKDASNPFFKSKYADLESCWEAVKGPLQANGLSVVQTMGFIPGAGPSLITTLLHTSGEYITGEQPVCAKADNPQDLGSAFTYSRRYGLSAIVGLIQVDDDGNSASGNKSGDDSSPKGKPNLQAVSDPGAYIMRMGKAFTGKRLDECGPHDLNGFANWLREQPKQSSLGNETIAAIEAFLATRPQVGNAK